MPTDRPELQQYLDNWDESGLLRMPEPQPEMLDIPKGTILQWRLRLLSFLQSSRARLYKDNDPGNISSSALIQEAIDLVCAGETEDAWLFHGPIGSPVEHLAIRKDTVPHRVAWVRVLLDIHVEMQGDTQIQGDTGAPT